MSSGRGNSERVLMMKQIGIRGSWQGRRIEIIAVVAVCHLDWRFSSNADSSTWRSSASRSICFVVVVVVEVITCIQIVVA